MSCCAPAAEAALDLERFSEASAEEIRLASRPAGPGLLQVHLSVPGAHCGACIRTIETALARLPGVEDARVNLSTRRVAVRWREGAAKGDVPPLVATLGRLGLVTIFLRDWLGVNIYALGFNILSFWGLTLTYLFFQIPLMVVIITPAIDGLKREWGEAAATLGATQLQYWRMVAIPVLWPSFLGTVILLFANAFGAIATAYALTGSSLNIVPILLYAQIRGDVLQDPHLGYALAFGMIFVTGLANVFYIWFRARSERWLR